MNSSIRRHIVGILALILFATASILYLKGEPKEGTEVLFYGACCRCAPVLFLIWLAWKPLEKLPPWLFVSLPIIVAAMLIHKRLIVVAVPVSVLVAFLNRPIKKRK